MLFIDHSDLQKWCYIFPTLQMGKLRHREVKHAQSFSRALQLSRCSLTSSPVAGLPGHSCPDSYNPIPPNHGSPGPAPTPVPEVEPDLITTIRILPGFLLVFSLPRSKRNVRESRRVQKI